IPRASASSGRTGTPASSRLLPAPRGSFRRRPGRRRSRSRSRSSVGASPQPSGKAASNARAGSLAAAYPVVVAVRVESPRSGFGFDSLIESLAAFVIVWLFTAGRGASATSERRAQRLIAASYFALVAYIAVEATRTLAGGQHPKTSWIGIALAAVTAPTMPLL